MGRYLLQERDVIRQANVPDYGNGSDFRRKFKLKKSPKTPKASFVEKIRTLPWLKQPSMNMPDAHGSTSLRVAMDHDQSGVVKYCFTE
jgi:hypothetical protein